MSELLEFCGGCDRRLALEQKVCEKDARISKLETEIGAHANAKCKACEKSEAWIKEKDARISELKEAFKKPHEAQIKLLKYEIAIEYETQVKELQAKVKELESDVEAEHNNANGVFAEYEKLEARLKQYEELILGAASIESWGDYVKWTGENATIIKEAKERLGSKE